jgi:two-component system sensor histidine kinase UhpB
MRTSGSGPAFIPLFWRLFVPNAVVLTAACVVLIVEPANGRIPALVGGLVLLLTVNLVLMRRTLDPLARVMRVMEEIDPLQPGRRLPVTRAQWEVTALTEAFNRMLERLETERRESGQRALRAQEGERRRVAAELHDEIGQQLTALVMDLERLRRDIPAGPEAELAQAAEAARATLEEVRHLAHRLRPEVLDELGLIPALRNLCDRMQASSGVLIRRALPAPAPALDAELELAVYRIAQESLTNVVRHARASTARVELRVEPPGLELIVTDDGVGMTGDTAGGIRGMRERALAVGARLELRESPAGGTEVLLRAPAG